MVDKWKMALDETWPETYATLGSAAMGGTCSWRYRRHGPFDSPAVAHLAVTVLTRADAMGLLGRPPVALAARIIAIPSRPFDPLRSGQHPLP